MTKKGVKNAEILFLYDAKLCNPNGDPDEENRPRMDSVTQRALVSDVRLKRYLRDYWIENKDELKIEDVWVRQKEDGTVTTADKRLKELQDKYEKETGKKSGGKKPTEEFKMWLLNQLVDVCLFGAVMPISSESGAGGHITYTGPVQFSWGYSLHPVEINPSSGITSTFAGRDKEGKGEHGTMGKDWRLTYALIAFYGIISKNRAKYTNMEEEDMELLRTSLIKAIPDQATTRSKIGQVPRLYIEIDYVGDYHGIGDLRDYIELAPKKSLDEIRETKDYEINMKSLEDKLNEIVDKIDSVHLWVHPSLSIGSFNPPKKKSVVV